MNVPEYFHDITIVIPAKDEAASIALVVRDCLLHASEVLVLDGDSTDGTAQIAREAGAQVINDHVKGKGAALRAVIGRLTRPITVFIDADGSHDVRDIARLIEPLRQDLADHVTASRLLGGSSELHGGFDEFFRLMGSAFITACINWRFSTRLSDSQNGFRAVRTEVLKALTLRETSTTIEQEMIMQTLRKNFRMAEIGSHEHRRLFGSSHVVLRKVWARYLMSLVRGLL